MKRCGLLLLILVGFISTSKAQESADKDIWYVWVDTYAQVDGVKKRVVSQKVSMISCCVKSPKYTRLLKTTTKWIRKI